LVREAANKRLMRVHVRMGDAYRRPEARDDGMVDMKNGILGVYQRYMTFRDT
jgi:hypothetical protein